MIPNLHQTFEVADQKILRATAQLLAEFDLRVPPVSRSGHAYVWISPSTPFGTARDRSIFQQKGMEIIRRHYPIILLVQ